MVKVKQKKMKYIFMLIIALTTVSLVAVILLSTYTRFFADDFCEASVAKSHQIFEYLKLRYEGWTGRYSFILFSWLTTSFGPKISSFFPALHILIWIISVVFAVYQILSIIKHPQVLISSIAYSGLFLVVLLSSMPKMFESVFWIIGSINYSMPLIIFTIMLGIFLLCFRKETNLLLLSLILIIAFVNSGFSEIFAFIQIVIFILAIILFFFTGLHRDNKSLFRFLLLGLIVSLVGILIVFIAPGNAARQAASSHPEPTSLMKLPFLIIRSTLVIFYLFLRNTGWSFIAILLIPFLFGFLLIDNRKNDYVKPSSFKGLFVQPWIKSILIIGLSVLIITMAAATPSSYIQGEYPTSRAMILPFYFIIAGLVLIFGTIGARVRNRYNEQLRDKTVQWARILLIVLVFVMLGSFTVETFRLLPAQRAYAQSWDALNNELMLKKAQGAQDVQTFNAVNAFGYGFIGPNPKDWVNRCVAKYYGFKSIGLEE